MKRVLFVSRIYPSDFNTSTYGIFLRMRTVLEGLQGVASQLDILFYVTGDMETSDEAVSKLEQNLSKEWSIDARVTLSRLAQLGPADSWSTYILPTLSVFKQPDFAFTSGPAQVKIFERCLASKPDAIYAFGLISVMPILLTKEKLPPIYFDLIDVEHVKLVRSLKQPPFWLSKYMHYLHVPALILGKRKAIKRAEKTFVCSNVDWEYLSKFWKLPRVVTLPNAVQIPSVSDQRPQSSTLLFLGSFTYGPNVVAAEFLVTRVWPLVTREIPDARLIIAGNKPERIPNFGAMRDNVEFAGFVSDLEKLYQRVQVVCCPILSGGGTRLKIIEAAAHGKAVISTTVGAEGLEFINESDIVIRDLEAGFADACIQLLRNPDQCEQIGVKARAKATKLYDRTQIIKGFQRDLEFH